MNLRAAIWMMSSKIMPRVLQQQIREIYYVNKVRKFDEREEKDLAVVRKLIRVGDVVCDVGANIGVYTVTLSRLIGGHGQVYSFEPVPETYRVLSNIVEHFHLRNVHIYGCAVSDSVGKGVMEVPIYNSGGENFYQARLICGNRPSRRTYEVDLVTLDSLFDKPGGVKLDFIKVDVEGHELQVIRGARHVLDRFRPALLIEISDNPDSDTSPARRLMTELGQMNYVPYWYDGTTLRQRVCGDRSINYFFLTNSHIAKLQSKSLQ